MKEKIFAAVIIILAILAIVYKLKINDYSTSSKDAYQNNLDAEMNVLSEENSEQNITKVENEINSMDMGSNVVNPNMVAEKEKNKIVQLTNENFDKEVLESDKTVIVDFYADWCGPCKQLSPILEEIAKENENLKVCKLNVDNEQELAIEYGANYLPTVLIIKNGEVVHKIIGLQEKSYILEKCQ